MKNLFLIPTDKPSKLHLIEDTLTITSDYKNSVCDGEVNIYITSDEEIKEGDCVIDNVGRIWIKMELCFVKVAKDNPYGKSYKIILTTDQDLINNGVQAINDEFLQWFVKNPSCKEVNVENEEYILQYLFKPQEYKFRYKIIIPTEEPNPFELPKVLPDDVFYESLEPKQETLEEAAKSNYEDKTARIPVPTSHWINSEFLQIQNFKEGAKWQQERMYSEEDMKNAWEDGREGTKTIGIYPFYQTIYKNQTFKEWFEQFKKK